MTIINTGKTVVSKYVRKQCPNDCKCSKCTRPSANPILEYVSTLIEHIPDPEDIASEEYVDNAVSGIIVDIANKADKVEGAVPGNFASLTNDGNLDDSGLNAGDFVSEQDLQDHINDTNNPHQVTAAQVGADVAGSAAAVQGNLTNHELLTTTAHGGIVADTDPRLTDNRDPNLHASTHFSGGTDEITPTDIGAVEEVANTDGLFARLRASSVGSWLAATTVGAALFAAVDAAAARSAIGAMPTVDPATAGNLVTLAADGTLEDAGYRASETGVGGTVVKRYSDGVIENNASISSFGNSAGAFINGNNQGAGIGVYGISTGGVGIFAQSVNGTGGKSQTTAGAYHHEFGSASAIARTTGNLVFVGTSANANRDAQLTELRGVNYGAAQTLSAAQQLQARTNIAAEQAGAAASVAGDLATHEGLTGTAVHGLGSAALLTAGTTGAALVATATTNAALATLEPVVTATVAADYVINAANGSVFVLTLTGNHQLSFSNLAAGRVITVHIIQDGTGNRVPTWSGMTWGATGEPTLLTGAGDRDKFSFDSYNGTVVDGHLIEQYEA